MSSKVHNLSSMSLEERNALLKRKYEPSLLTWRETRNFPQGLHIPDMVQGWAPLNFSPSVTKVQSTQNSEIPNRLLPILKMILLASESTPRMHRIRERHHLSSNYPWLKPSRMSWLPSGATMNSTGRMPIKHQVLRGQTKPPQEASNMSLMAMT